MTELEYREALVNQKTILIYFMKDAKIQNENEEVIRKYERFRSELQRNHTVFMFDDTSHLEKQVLADLLRISQK